MKHLSLAFLAATALPQAPLGQGTCTESAPLIGNDTAANDKLGLHDGTGPVALDGDTLVVGFRRSSVLAPNSGCIYVFEHDGVDWGAAQQCFASNPASNKGFAKDVAIHGDTIVVGATNASTPNAFGNPVSSGVVHVFERDPAAPCGWTETAIVPPPSPLSGSHFGEAVAIDGDTLVVGAPYTRVNFQSNRGSVHVYQRVAGAWLHVQELVDPSGDLFDRYGTVVDVDGPRIVAGSFSAGPGLSDDGVADVWSFDGANWNLAADLVPTGQMSGKRYGFGVAISGTTVAVSAPEHPDSSGITGGCVFLFEEVGGTWTELAHVSPMNLAAGDAFGYSVDLDADRLLVGSPFDDLRAGSIYACDRNGSSGPFSDCQRIQVSTSAPAEFFGMVVASSGDRLAGAAPLDDIGANDTGAVYVYDCPSPPASPLAGEYHLAGIELSLYGHSGGALALVMDTGEIEFDPSNGSIVGGQVTFDRTTLSQLAGFPLLVEDLMTFPLGGTYSVDPAFGLSLQMGPDVLSGTVAAPAGAVSDAFALRFVNDGSGHSLRGLVLGGAKSTAFTAADLAGRYGFSLLHPVVQPFAAGAAQPDVAAQGFGALAGESLLFSPQSPATGSVAIAARPRGAVLDLSTDTIAVMGPPPGAFTFYADYAVFADGRVEVSTSTPSGIDDVFSGFATPDGELLVMVQRQNAGDIDAAGNATKGKRDVLFGVAQPSQAPADPLAAIAGTYQIYGLGLGVAGQPDSSMGAITSSLTSGALTFDGQGGVAIDVDVDRVSLDIATPSLDAPGPFNTAGQGTYGMSFDPSAGLELTIPLGPPGSGSALSGSVSENGDYLVLELHGPDAGAEMVNSFIGLRIAP